MNIAIISPQAHNTGTTTLSILVALELASRGKKVCLTHANSESASFYDYFNLKSFEDRTVTPSQVVKLLREGDIRPEEISDYCKKVNDTLEVFSNNSKAFTSDDMKFMLEKMGTHFPHDYIFFDVDVGAYDMPNYYVSSDIIKYSDAIIVNVTQSIQQLKEFGARKEVITEMFRGKPVLVVVNKFCEIQSTLKETSTWMGIKAPNNWMILRNNPWIPFGTNHGKIVDVFKKMKDKDTRVIDIASDIEKIADGVLKLKAAVKKAGN